MEEKIKRAFSSFAAIALVSAMAAAAMAQSNYGIPPVPPTASGVPGMVPNPGPVGKFDRGYLDKHPEVAGQLAQNPGLANDPQFLATHPGLDSYLANHPEVRTDLQQHPDRFMDREHRYERFENTGQWKHPFGNWRLADSL